MPSSKLLGPNRFEFSLHPNLNPTALLVRADAASTGLMLDVVLRHIYLYAVLAKTRLRRKKFWHPSGRNFDMPASHISRVGRLCKLIAISLDSGKLRA
jgi:hypothetical protein